MRRILRLTSILASFVAPVIVAGGLCGGCGSGARVQTILETKRPIVALAIRRSDVAWLTPADWITKAGYSLWLRASGRNERLPWPHSSSFDSNFLQAELSLACGNVGWIVVTQEGNWGDITMGASSLQPRRTKVLESDTIDGGQVTPETGTLISGVAATEDAILWGTVDIAFRRTPGWQANYCDLWPAGNPCQTRVAGGAIRSWSGGASTVVRALPPSAAIAGGGGLVAIATWPRAQWTKGYPQLGPIEVSVLGGPVLTRIELPKRVREMRSGMELWSMALSRRLLAVELSDGVSLYEIPSGRFLGTVAPGSASRIAVTRNKLVLWSEQRAIVVDPQSGRRTLIATSSAPPSHANATTITAVATDGDRLAWARTDPRGRSIVRMIHVD